MPRSFHLTVLLLWAAAAAAAQSVSPSIVEGTVRLAAAPVLLVETSSGPVAVVIQPHTIFEGAVNGAAIVPGDILTVESDRREREVLFASKLSIRPVPVLDGRFMITAPELARLLSGGGESPPLVVDCRGTRAFSAGHIPGAEPLRDAEKRLGGRPIILAGEDRHSREPFDAFQRHHQAGLPHLRVLAGGTQGWSQADRVVDVLPDGVPVPLPPPWELLIVDIRVPEAFAAGHLPGAFNVTLDRMRPQDLSRKSGMPPLLLYGGGVGDQALATALRAIRWRFQDAFNLDGPAGVLAGGIEAWIKAGRPVEFGPTAPFTLEAIRRPEEVGEAELARIMSAPDSGPLLVDLRKTAESRPRGALHLPLEELVSRMDELPRDREVILFCALGIRSRIGYVVLRQNGYQVRYLREAPAP